MDIDFHYYATYVAARFAGYPKEDALTIATSAQMIDENARHALINKKISIFTTGAVSLNPDTFDLHHHAEGPSIHKYRVQMTFQGHGDIGTSYADTLSSIWPVYHFLPGNFTNQFNSDTRWQPRTLKSSLQTDSNVKKHFEWLCRPHSGMAIRLINNCRELIHDKTSVINKNELGNYLVGVTAHVFADTWAHQDFVGFGVRQINSRSEIQESKKGSVKIFGSRRHWDVSYSFLKPKSVFHLPSLIGRTEKSFSQQTAWKSCDWEQCAPAILTTLVDNATIGHGIVGHLPDHSGVLWKYNPAWSDQEIVRNNPVEYFDAFVHLVWAMRCIRLNQDYTPFDVKPTEVAGKINVSAEKLLAVYQMLTLERHPWSKGANDVKTSEDTDDLDTWDGMIFLHGFQWQSLIEDVLGFERIDSWVPLQSNWVMAVYQAYQENQEIKKGNWLTIKQFKSLEFFKFNIAAKFHYRFVKQELLANGKLLLGNWADGAAYADDLERIAEGVTSYETWRQNIIRQLSDLQRTEKKREVNEGITILIRDIEEAESLTDVCAILKTLIENVNRHANTWTYGLLDEKGIKLQSKAYFNALNKIIAEYKDVSGVQQPLTDMVQGALLEYDKHKHKLFASPSKASLAAAAYLQTRLNDGVPETQIRDSLLYLLGLTSKGSKSSKLLLEPLKKGSKLYTLLYQALIKSS